MTWGADSWGASWGRWAHIEAKGAKRMDGESLKEIREKNSIH